MQDSETKTVTNSKHNQVSAHGEKSKPNAATSIRELFVDELKDIYYAEKLLTKALPKMISNATAPNLVQALTAHLEETKGQVTRLEEIFSSIGEKPEAKKCDAMDGITKEAQGIMEETTDGEVRDAGIISAGRKVEHYEIATYSSLCAIAKNLGETKAVTLLQQTLDEETKADAKLLQMIQSMHPKTSNVNGNVNHSKN